MQYLKDLCFFSTGLRVDDPALFWGIVMVLDWRLGLSPVSLLPLTFLLQMTVKRFGARVSNTLWNVRKRCRKTFGNM
jgi:ABC transporter, permease/ATP-binding protein